VNKQDNKEVTYIIRVIYEYLT